ncbi:hypothetical protein BABINDRAFT_24523, partial [Babjeviella inositovora NRRL Y-12698]
NHYFCFGGRFRTAKHSIYLNIFMFMAIILPLVVFLVFEAKWTWHHVSPAVPLLFVYVWLVCAASFVKAAGGDPGVLPRNVHLTENVAQLPEEYFNTITIPAFQTGSVAVKYCATCRIWRPARTSHCLTCDACVTVHDHHCVWLNNCVGLRNYMYFMEFLAGSILCCLYILGFTVYRLAKLDSFRHAIRTSPMSFMLAIYSSLVMIYPTILFGFHLYLNVTAQTTREFLGNIHKPVGEQTFWQYSEGSDVKGALRNAAHVWLRVRGPSALRVRDPYVHGDRRWDKLA